VGAATHRKREGLRWTAVAAAVLAGVVFAISGASFASSTAVAVADVDAPTGSVTLAPGASGNITIQVTVSGAQDGDASFQINRNWSLSGGVWSGSNQQTFNVPGPRAGNAVPLILNTTGTVSVAAGQADGTFPLSVQVFNVTNSNQQGAKLSAGTAANYSVSVATPAPSDTQAPQGVSISINSGAAWTTDANGDVALALSGTDNVGVASYKLATSQAGLAAASAHAVSPAEASFGRSTVPFTLSSGEGAAKEVWFQACDAIGNCTSDKDTIGWDKTAPSIGFVSRTAANANGWNSGNVTVNWSCSDDLSGAVAASVTDTVSGEGANQSSTGTCHDLAGNSAGDIQTGINIDKTKPSISYLSRTAANGNGWNDGDVTLSWSCADALSEAVDSPISTTVSSEGANQSSTGTCYDLAGNSASDIQTGINIDKTKPSITLTGRSPAANAAGWNKTDVTLTWSCTDLLSGPVSASVSNTVSTEGVGQSSTGTCEDHAGNSASNTQTGIKIDKTAPSLSWSGGPTDGASYYFGSVPAAPTCSASDGLSGPNGCDVTGYLASVGTHTVTATAHDLAGNDHAETRTYTVLAWTLNGFYQPTDMSGVWNTVKSGSTVPLKFEVFSGATELTDTAVVNQPLRATQTPCTGGTVDDIELVATGSTMLRYDATAGQFIYNWQTPKKVGFCYVVTVTTADGSSISANFKLK
jgi:hypothetical protein